MDVIADRCGFSSAELLRRCFLRHFKIAPSQYRKHSHPPAATLGDAAGRAGPSISMASR
jgi:AraC-like DNA-binding protein